MENKKATKKQKTQATDKSVIVQKARLSMVPMSVKKLAPILDIIRGKEVYYALDMLRLMPKKAAKYTFKLLKSAISDVEHNKKISAKGMKVLEIYATPGPKIKRYRAGARMRVKPYVKYRANIFIKIGHVS